MFFRRGFTGEGFYQVANSLIILIKRINRKEIVAIYIHDQTFEISTFTMSEKK